MNISSADKGLMNSIFGGGAAGKAAAPMPETAKVFGDTQVAGTPDFSVLMKTESQIPDQGQKQAQQAAVSAQTKEGLKQLSEQSKVETKTQAKALPKTLGQSESVNSETAMAQAAMLAAAAQPQAQPQPQAKLVPEQKQAQPQAQVKAPVQELSKTKEAVQGAVGPASTQLPKGQLAIEKNKGDDVVEKIMSQLRGKTERVPSSAVLSEKTVAQAPVQAQKLPQGFNAGVEAMPGVQVMSATENFGAITGAKGREENVSSQDFLENRAGSADKSQSKGIQTPMSNLLGVHRPDPRLMDRESRDGLANQEKQREESGRPSLSSVKTGAGLENMSLVLPQLNDVRMPVAQTTAPLVQASLKPEMRSVDVSNPVSIATQVNGLALKGGGAMKVKITPEHLGEMTISVQQKGNKLDVKMEAATKEAKEALLESMDGLKETLKLGRFEVGNIEVKSKPQASTDLGSMLSSSKLDAGLGLDSMIRQAQMNDKQDTGSGNQGWQQRYARDQYGSQQQDSRGSGSREERYQRAYDWNELGA